jgi:hypothetical protein
MAKISPRTKSSDIIDRRDLAEFLGEATHFDQRLGGASFIDRFSRGTRGGIAVVRAWIVQRATCMPRRMSSGG